MSIFVKANELRENGKTKRKEVDVIAHDIGSRWGKKIEEHINVLSCVWYMYYDMSCYYTP